MRTPLVASVVVGMIGWLKGHRLAAIVPAILSAFTAVIVAVVSHEEFWG